MGSNGKKSETMPVLVKVGKSQSDEFVIIVESAKDGHTMTGVVVPLHAVATLIADQGGKPNSLEAMFQILNVSLGAVMESLTAFLAEQK